MTCLPGTRSFYRNERLFEPLLTFMTAFDALGIATECMKTGVLDRTPGNVGIEAHQFARWIRFPALKPTDAMTRNIVPDGFQLIFSPDKGRRGPQIGPLMSGYKSTTMAITTAIYVEFFERHVDWIRQKFGADTMAWPSLFNFARMIRNFIVHHNGNVHFENPRASRVTWHHLSYSPEDEGKPAVGHNYISVGDMIVLLVEFGDALDSAGCPFPLGASHQ